MISSQPSTRTNLGASWFRALRLLASAKLTAVLLAIFAAALLAANLLQQRLGTDSAHGFVYDRGWFTGLLMLLGINAVSALAVRWSRRQWPAVAGYAGLLILLAGSAQSLLTGQDGRVTLIQGELSERLMQDRQSTITAFWIGRPQEPPFEFSLEAGPRDWPAGKAEDLGELDGVRVRVCGFVRRPRAVEEWIADDSRQGGPVVKFRITGTDGKQVAESWLADRQFGDAVLVGPLRLQLERAASDRMLDDFSRPLGEAGDANGEHGFLTMHHGPASLRVPVSGNVGKRIEISDSGVAVEIAEYLPNAKPGRLGEFVSRDERPKNPMVELRVFLPGEEQPLRQIAFAKDPLLNLDGIYPRVCPVKFRFHHPAIQSQSAFELLQTSDGRLFARQVSAGSVQFFGEVKAGQKLALPAGFQIEILEHRPSARQKLTYVVDQSAAAVASEPAALIEVQHGGGVQQTWLLRNDLHRGQQTLTLPSGIMAVKFASGEVPLGFSLKLLDVVRDRAPQADRPPGSPEQLKHVGGVASGGRLQVAEAADGANREIDFTLRRPIEHGRYTLRPIAIEDAGHGRVSATFEILSDPGRSLRHIGALGLILGFALQLLLRLRVTTAVEVAPIVEQRLAA